MKKIKITVVRKVCHRDLIERFVIPIDHACDMREGQVFVAVGVMKNPASAMISCNDGFRPVSFLIETLD